MDWEKIDSDYKYSYREDRLKIAKSLGYNYISQCTAMLYEGFKSTSKVANILGLTASGVATELKKIGVTLKKRGGNNYGKKTNRHHWNPLATNTRAPLSRAQ